MRRLLCIVFFALNFFGVFLFPKNAQAIAKFNTEFQNYYRIDQSGNTHVSFVIKQKNNLSVVYATEFGLSVNETKISNVKVTDEGIHVTPEVVKTLNQTTISFPFASKVVGKDKVHTFVIEYDTTDVAIKHGTTWQINIPRLETDENISDQKVILTVPENFPVPAYIDPKPDQITQGSYYFSGNKIANKTISAVFGQSQFYKGHLEYHLQNDSIAKSSTEIALPPDTAYQSVYFEKLTPQPETIRVDEDGNYLAQYRLDPKTKIDIALDIYVKLNFNPKTSDALPTYNLLQSNSIWNFDNSVFTTPEIKNLSNAKAIFDYVSDKMQYDYEKVNRQRSQKTPAAESLMNSQSAICTDFTNVFIALSRKAGIPAREIQGYAISENTDLKPLSLTQDVLHAWPEYYNSNTKTWTQVDPTWTNTTRGIDYFNKLDFNHITFVIHGKNSDYPIPAGGYKSENQNTKDISINPVEEIKFPDPTFTLKQEKQENNYLFIEVKNTSGISFKGNTITSKNDYLAETEQNITVPPFGQTSLKIKLTKTPIIGKISTNAIIYLNGQRFDQKIIIGSSISPLTVFSVVGAVLASIAFFARHLYLRRQKQKTSLYR